MFFFFVSLKGTYAENQKNIMHSLLCQMLSKDGIYFILYNETKPGSQLVNAECEQNGTLLYINAFITFLSGTKITCFKWAFYRVFTKICSHCISISSLKKTIFASKSEDELSFVCLHDFAFKYIKILGYTWKVDSYSHLS